ncbi:MAG: hypothetical protein ACRD2H_15975 [Terriglobales bacterium]
MIEGIVLGEGGRPLPSARVNALQMGVALGTAAPEAETDANGRFRMTLLSWGKYAVIAQKVSDQSPNSFGMNSSLYGEPPAPVAVLSPSNPLARVIVRLGPRAGALDLKLIDAVTGAPLPYIAFAMSLVGNPRVGESGSQGCCTVLFPPGRAVFFRVEMPGYQPWQARLRLASGERRKLEIRLWPVPKQK